MTTYPPETNHADRPSTVPPRLVANGTTAQPVKGRSTKRTDYRLRGLEIDDQRLDTALPAPQPSQPRRLPGARRRRRVVLELLLFLVVAAAVSLWLRSSVIQPYSIPTRAMTPTLHSGDRILVAKAELLVGRIRTGSIVVFHTPAPYSCQATGGGAGDQVQRVIGLPGQVIWSAGGQIYLDGRLLREKSWYNSKFSQVGPIPIPRTKIPAGQYFVLADNRSDSCDSRTFGTVPRSSIVGRVIAIVLRNGHPHLRVL